MPNVSVLRSAFRCLSPSNQKMSRQLAVEVFILFLSFPEMAKSGMKRATFERGALVFHPSDDVFWGNVPLQPSCRTSLASQ